MMGRSLREIKAALGHQASRRGLCNSPHPDPKYLEPAMVPSPDGATYRDTAGKLQVVYVEAMAPTVRCGMFAGHDGDCQAYSFSISEQDHWPKPEGWGE